MGCDSDVNSLRIAVDQWLELNESCNNSGFPVTFRVKGRSMLPIIRPDRDTVTVHPVSEPLKIGDIVLFQNRDIYCLHRIIKIEGNGVQTQGDGNQYPDNWINNDQILGKATLVKRGLFTIKFDSFIARKWSGLWVSLLPVRSQLLFPYRLKPKIFRMVSRIRKRK